jgi:hypothetical protein
MEDALAPEELPDWVLARKKPSEARRASRIECDLWVRVGGVDVAARARSGNISVTGLYVSLEEAVGSPGDVVWLSLASIDKARSAQTMARITRVVRQDDLHRGAAVVGAGFEFLPVEQPQPEIVDVVRHVTSVALGLCGGVMLDHDHTVRVSRSSAGPINARLLSLGRDRVVLSSPTALPLGEMLRIEVTEPSGGRIHVHGSAGPSEHDYSDESGGRFAVVVRFTAPVGPAGATPHDEYADRVVESLRDALIAPRRLPAPEPRRRDLSGQLSRVHLSSVLSLLEMEHLEGIVTVANERTAARIYLAHGRIVDAELDHSTLAARDVLTELVGWTEGEFSIVCVPVRRRDRFEMPTTALLLDVTRERDERVA